MTDFQTLMDPKLGHAPTYSRAASRRASAISFARQNVAEPMPIVTPDVDALSPPRQGGAISRTVVKTWGGLIRRVKDSRAVTVAALAEYLPAVVRQFLADHATVDDIKPTEQLYPPPLCGWLRVTPPSDTTAPSFLRTSPASPPWPRSSTTPQIVRPPPSQKRTPPSDAAAMDSPSKKGRSLSRLSSGRFGAEAVWEILSSYMTSVVTIIDRGGGDIIRIAGDLVIAFFPGSQAPIAASRAALTLLEEMSDRTVLLTCLTLIDWSHFRPLGHLE
jgi:hypothetical protein